MISNDKLFPFILLPYCEEPIRPAHVQADTHTALISTASRGRRLAMAGRGHAGRPLPAAAWPSAGVEGHLSLVRSADEPVQFFRAHGRRRTAAALLRLLAFLSGL